MFTKEKERERGMKRMSDKGFTLVELIIVVSIMSILLVILTPQYLKYVEKSRNSIDLQNASQIVTALQVYAGDPDAATPPAGDSITIDSESHDMNTSKFTGAALADAGLLHNGKLETRCQSKTNWTSYTITWTVSDGGLNFVYSSTAEGTETTGTDIFAERMAGANYDIDSPANLLNKSRSLIIYNAGSL